MGEDEIYGDTPHMSGKDFARQAEAIAAWIVRYWESVESMRVRSAATPGEIFDALPASAPDVPQPVWDTLLHELDSTVVPGLTHWQHPSFFGYFPANASGPAVLGELISAGLGVQGMLWSTSPACTEVEMRVMDWLAQAYGLPEAFTHAKRLQGQGAGGGVIQSTASEATLVALVAARHRALRGASRRSTRAAPDAVRLERGARVGGESRDDRGAGAPRGGCASRAPHSCGA